MVPHIAIVGTLDTKGQEVAFLKQLIEQSECIAIVVDVGILGEAKTGSDFSREMVASAGGLSLDELLATSDRRVAVQTMTRGARSIVGSLYNEGRVSGVISVGGGTGTHIGTGVMRGLPLGLPKLMLSTVASRDMSELIGTKDIVMMHSVIDILGLNAISRKILSHAAAAIVGMARNGARIEPTRPIVGLTSFGFITQGAMLVKGMLEAQGYEVAPFHANGTGGMALEDLIDQGLISGVLDLALHEFSDQLYGGYCGGIGPDRLEMAGRKGIPQVVVPGGLDCIVLEFDSPATIPERVKGRKVFWYDFRSGVRTVASDLIQLARTIAEKLNRATGPVTVLIPMKGWSEADAPEGPLHEPETNQVFVDELKSLLSSSIHVVEVDLHINQREFAALAVMELDRLMRGAGRATRRA